MTSCSGVSGRYRGVIFRTIQRFSHNARKKASPNTSPSTARVLSTLQKTSEKPTSRNHSRSTKTPESAVNAKGSPARTATTTTTSRRRPDIGVGAGRRTTMWVRDPPGSGAASVSPPPAEQDRLRGDALDVGEGVVEARHGDELHPAIARSPRGAQVALGHEEYPCTGVGGGGELLADAGDRDHGPVQRDRAGPGDGPPARQVARREQVV